MPSFRAARVTLSRRAPNERMEAFLAMTRRSRFQESQADQWAVDQYATVPNPWGLILTLGYFVSFSGFDCSMEAADSHPNGFQRFVKVITRLRNQMGKNHKPVPKEIDSVITDTKILADKAKEQLRCAK